MLPYLEVIKSKETEQQNITQIEMPDVTGITLKEAKTILKELGVEYEIETEDLEAIITNQVPKKGIQISSGTKIILSTQ